MYGQQRKNTGSKYVSTFRYLIMRCLMCILHVDVGGGKHCVNLQLRKILLTT